MKILLLEDDKVIAEQISDYFSYKGHAVELFYDGESLLASRKILEADICIFDINVPKLNGLETLKVLRELNIQKPIIFLTALSDMEHVKSAYMLGCEDYIRKPFHFEELELRIHKLINHCTQRIAISKTFSFDTMLMHLYCEDAEVVLSEIEKKLLYLLIKNRNYFVSTNTLIEYVWEDESICNNTLRTTIKRLRLKLPKECIVSSRSFGYKVVTDD